MRSKLVTAPAIEPLDTSEAKQHLRVDITDDDVLIDSLVKSARQYVEQTTGMKLITQTWDVYAEDFPDGNTLSIPVSPVQSVTGVYYTDTDDTESTFAGTDYDVFLDEWTCEITLKSGKSWPSVGLRPSWPVRVRVVAGFGDAGVDVPEPIRRAMLLLVGHLYENRESVVVGVRGPVVAMEVPMTVKALLAPYRKVPV